MLQYPKSRSEEDFLRDAQARLELKRGQVQRRENPAIPQKMQGPVTPKVSSVGEFTALAQRLATTGVLEQAIPDPELPRCPLCEATAWHSVYRHALDLSHDCDCALLERPLYDAALRRLWVGERALKGYLETVPTRFRSSRLEDLTQTPHNLEAFKAAAGFSHSSFLYLWGAGGVGKTELACALGARFAQGKESTRFMSALEWAKKLKNAVGAPLENPKPNLESPQVLILDELDKIKPSEFMHAALHELLDYRWREQKATVLLSNHDEKWISRRLALEDTQNAEALRSRLASGRVIRMGGVDGRPGSAL